MRPHLRWAALAVLSACGGAQPAPSTPRVLGATHLDHIPDDTPFVVVSEPSPRSTFFARQRERAAADFDTLLQRVVAAPAASADAAPAERALRGLARRLTDAQAPTHWRTIGLFEPSPMALYVAHHALIARFVVKQPEGLRALVDGLAADAGIPLQISQEGGLTLLDLAFGHPQLGSPHVLVVLGAGSARIGVTPGAHLEQLRAHLLDLDGPTRSLLDTGRLARLAQAEGLGDESVLVMDVPALVAGLDLGACQADVARLVDGLTHIYSGVRGGADGATSTTRLRFSPAAMATLSSVLRPAPRLSPAGDASLYAASIGFDLAGLQAHLRSVSDALKVKPLTCGPLVELNELLTTLPTAALSPTPFDGVDGFAVELHTLDVKASRFAGAAFLGARDPAALLALVPFGLAAGFAPGLQTPEVGGPVQHVPLVGNLASLGTLHLGAGPRGVALGLGTLPAGTFDALVAQPAGESGAPWARVVIDSAATRSLTAGEAPASDEAGAVFGLELLRGVFEMSSQQRVVVERRGDDVVFAVETRAAPDATPPKP